MPAWGRMHGADRAASSSATCSATHYVQVLLKSSSQLLVSQSELITFFGVMQVKIKLAKARQDLVQAESAHQAAHTAIHTREKQKKWLKF